MDPNANLAEQLQLAAFILDAMDSETETGVVDAAQTLATLVQELDQWRRRGGFLPAAWSR